EICIDRISTGRVTGLDPPADLLGNSPIVQTYGQVACAAVRGYSLGVARFIKARIGEAQGESAWIGRSGQRRHHARVEPPAQEAPDRGLGRNVLVPRAAQRGLDPGRDDLYGRGRRRALGAGRAPVSPRALDLRAADAEPTGGRERPDTCDECRRLG